MLEKHEIVLENDEMLFPDIDGTETVIVSPISNQGKYASWQQMLSKPASRNKAWVIVQIGIRSCFLKLKQIWIDSKTGDKDEGKNNKHLRNPMSLTLNERGS